MPVLVIVVLRKAAYHVPGGASVRDWITSYHSVERNDKGFYVVAIIEVICTKKV